MSDFPGFEIDDQGRMQFAFWEAPVHGLPEANAGFCCRVTVIEGMGQFVVLTLLKGGRFPANAIPMSRAQALLRAGSQAIP